jgi:lysophospholipid acyltransferase (LPLAT)-like uncharacterized protein
MRMETKGQESIDALYREGKRVIIAFWHARQLMMPLTYRGTQAHILISQHQDGEIIARVVERFGLKAVRGSSTRGGVEALRELIRLGRSGVDLVVTPDGPKGPAQVAKMGVIQLARASGLPIVPLAFGCSKKKHFASWDRFMVPYPCSRGLYLWGAPIWVPRELDESALETKRLELETTLNRMTAEVDEAVGS